MPAEIVSASFCADYWGIFRIKSAKGDATYDVTFNGGEGQAFCTCKAFLYSKKEPKHCKHIEKVFQNGCFWNPQWFDGNFMPHWRPLKYTNEPDREKPCPNCCGPTMYVRIAV